MKSSRKNIAAGPTGVIIKIQQAGKNYSRTLEAKDRLYLIFMEYAHRVNGYYKMVRDKKNNVDLAYI
jgi:hypothetical protein